MPDTLYLSSGAMFPITRTATDHVKNALNHNTQYITIADLGDSKVNVKDIDKVVMGNGKTMLPVVNMSTDDRMQLGGSQIKKGANQMLTGFGVGLGTAVAVGFINDLDGMVTTGIVGGVTSLVFTITGIVNIRKGGITLSGNGVKINF